MNKEEFTKIYKRPEFVCFEEDLKTVIKSEITRHEIKKVEIIQKQLIKENKL